ncbi:MAG: EAL domain-containing protein [Spirochaetales bacterium]|nr:EAL domain-containing protein [Spirochaetales bacterium]
MRINFRNNWFIFFIIMFFMLCLYIYASYSVWQETAEGHRIANENRTRLIAKSTEGFLYQVEIIQELIEETLRIREKNWTLSEIKTLFDKTISMNEAIHALALISPEGEFLISSLDETPEKRPNLLENETTRETFLETLASESLVMGRTYLLALSDDFIFPVRQTLFDPAGNPAAVLTLAVHAQEIAFIDDDILNSGLDSIHILRSKDRYPLIFISNDESLKLSDVYNTPIPEEVYRDSLSRMERSSGLPIEKIMDEERIVSFRTTSAIDGQSYLISSRYLNRYELWVNSYLRYDRITKEATRDSLWYLVFFMGTALILYLLFLYIYRIEKRKKEDLEHRASHDNLTELHNRDSLYLMYDDWRQNNSSHAALLIDIDNFSYINDSFGHRAGDTVIKAIAKSLRSVIEDGDSLFRVDGDEFVLLTPRVDNLEGFCTRIQKELSLLDPLRYSRVTISTSIGICLYPQDASDIEEILIHSNISLTEAKKKKNSFCFFSESMKAEFLRKIELEKEIDTGLLHDEFSIVYQPQMKIDNTMRGVEALLRWNNGRFGFIPPDVFIPIVEASGKMNKVGDFLIRRALTEICSVQQKTGKLFNLALNISVMQFMEKDFANSFISLVKEFDLPAGLITLEVTESVFINELDYVVSQLDRLIEKGFTISMDDFGTGYSSLSMLRKIPIDELKIDKTFVDDINSDESAQHMVRTIISIGKILEYKTILAEGVENEDQLQLLHSFGCDSYQGYHFSKPLPENDLLEYVKSHQTGRKKRD